MRTAVFLPVKGTSERIESKNTRLMDGIPLFMHTLKKLVEADIFNEVWLDSESRMIHDLARGIPCRHLYRDPELATNKADGNQMFINEVNHTEADLVIQILCTSPFIQINTIQRGVEVLLTNQDYDSAVLIRRDKRYEWNELGPAYDCSRIPNSVDLPTSISETMGLYIMRRKAALRLGRRIGERPFLLEASPLEAVDINNPEDFPLAEFIATGIREKERRRFSFLKHYLSSPLLSDIFDDLGHKGIISGCRANLNGAKMLGRAFTLHLRPLAGDEDSSGIYKTVDTYDRVVPGDVIMVQNDVPEYAYFGELNANMAIRAGAVGAVISGVSRDSSATSAMGFPVFSRGISCIDVRGRATMGSFYETITISGVEISPGDLVFGDDEGIAVLPPRLESTVLGRVVAAVAREKTILSSLLGGCNPGELYSRYGGF